MKKAVQFGAGNIGRGFMGELFHKSGYEVVFVEVDPDLLSALNEKQAYPLRIVSNEETTEITIHGVRAVDGRDIERISDEIATADIAATAVGAGALEHIAAPLAAGLKKRWQDKTPPLNIILCENMVDADQRLAKLLQENLPERMHPLLKERVGLIRASIGRMVPKMTPAMQEGNILRMWVEPFNELPVDGEAFVEPVPEIRNMSLCRPFDWYIQKKLFIHNTGHAFLAYLGFLRGHTYIWQAVEDPELRLLTKNAMYESKEALAVQKVEPAVKIEEHIADLLHRFANRALKDTVARVGRDPKRKLGPDDRLIGACRIVQKQGKQPESLPVGAAAALEFAPEGDPSAAEIRKMVTKRGPEAVLKEVSELDPASSLGKRILHYHEILSGKEGLAGLIQMFGR